MKENLKSQFEKAKKSERERLQPIQSAINLLKPIIDEVNNIDPNIKLEIATINYLRDNK